MKKLFSKLPWMTGISAGTLTILHEIRYKEKLLKIEEQKLNIEQQKIDLQKQSLQNNIDFQNFKPNEQSSSINNNNSMDIINDGFIYNNVNTSKFSFNDIFNLSFNKNSGGGMTINPMESFDFSDIFINFDDFSGEQIIGLIFLLYNIGMLISIIFIIIEIKIFNYLDNPNKDKNSYNIIVRFKNFIKFSANINVYFFAASFLFNFGLSIITSLYYLFK